MAAPAILMSRRLRRRRSSRRRSGRCDLPPFSWTRLACHVPLGLLGREIAQSRVDPLPIIVALHVSEEIAPRLVARGPAALMNELDLEGVEEALHRGIVIAVPGPAHRGLHAGFGEKLSVFAGSILRTTIRVMDEPRARALALARHQESRRGEFRAQVVPHRPAHHLAGREIEHSGEIEPTLAGGHIGEICEPDLVRGRRYEALLDQVGSDGQPMVAVRGHGPEAARGRGPDPVLVHEALDPTPADAPALSPQRGMHSRRAVATPVLSIQASHIGQQVESGSGSRALGPALPGVVAGSRDAEHLAHDAHRPLLLVISDEPELIVASPRRCRWLPKKLPSPW